MAYDIQTIQIVTGIIVSLIVILGAIFVWFRKFWRWIFSFVRIKKNNNIEYNRNLVAEWRKMVHEVANQHDKSDKSISHLLERHKSYYSLKPRLSQNTIKQITRNTIFIGGTTIDSALQYILRDIANFEKNKGLL